MKHRAKDYHNIIKRQEIQIKNYTMEIRVLGDKLKNSHLKMLELKSKLDYYESIQ